MCPEIHHRKEAPSAEAMAEARPLHGLRGTGTNRTGVPRALRRKHGGCSPWRYTNSLALGEGKMLNGLGNRCPAHPCSGKWADLKQTPL